MRKVMNAGRLDLNGSSPCLRRVKRLAGFTLIELLVVIAIIAILAGLLLPALAAAKKTTQGIFCMNNHKALCLCWHMYADDNRDVITYASSGDAGRNGESTPPDPTQPSNPNNYAWSGAHMDYTGANLGNWDTNYDMAQRPLWPYNKSQPIYKCPSDTSTVSWQGVVYNRILSMDMNLYVGGFSLDTKDWQKGNPETQATLCGGNTFGYDSTVFRRLSQIRPASDIFVFLDMRQDAQNWSNFMQDMTGSPQGPNPNTPNDYQYSDVPGCYHNKACGFSFADGHSEIHKWQEAITCPPLLQPPTVCTLNNTLGGNNLDIQWLIQHASTPLVQ